MSDLGLLAILGASMLGLTGFAAWMAERTNGRAPAAAAKSPSHAPNGGRLDGQESIPPA